MKKSLIISYPPHKPIGISKTIPSQAFTVQDILRKFAGGQMLDEIMREDVLGDDDEDIDTPFDVERSGSQGDFDTVAAHAYVGTVEEEIKKSMEKARQPLDNVVLDDTKEKKSSEKVADEENS